MNVLSFLTSQATYQLEIVCGANEKFFNVEVDFSW